MSFTRTCAGPAASSHARTPPFRRLPPCTTARTVRISFELDGLICNAHWQVREIPVSYQGQVFKLNQLFTPHRRLDAAEISALRESLGVAPGHYLVGAVARLARSKGLDTLIDAFSRRRPAQCPPRHPR